MRSRNLKIKFASRVARTYFLRLLLKLSLGICFLEDKFNPPRHHQERKRVLVIVFGGLGDCLLFDPLFRRMREQWPNVCIDVLTGSFESMWMALSSIDNLIFFRRNSFKSPLGYFRLFRRIYRNRYALVIEGLAMLPKRGVWGILTSLLLEASQASECIGRSSTGHLPYLVDIQPGFVGAEKNKQSTGDIRAWPIKRLIAPPMPDKRDFHEARYVAEAIGLEFFRKPDEPRLNVEPLVAEYAEMLARDKTGINDILVGLVMETTYPLKRWPVERFEALIRRALEKGGLRFVLLGLYPEQATKLDFGDKGRSVINLVGKTTLAQMMSIIAECNIFLSADTGPAHIAQACGIPSIILFGPSNEREFGPADLESHTMLLPEEELTCRPCVLGPCIRGQSCMYLISVDRVYKALEEKILSIRAQYAAGNVGETGCRTNVNMPSRHPDVQFVI
jgi:ADP-heptose:LPS heptosyltransferase